VFAIAAMSLSAGAAAASSADGPPSASQLLEHMSAEAVEAIEAICARWDGSPTDIPIPAEYVPVCKLVNGWD
jgi:hypothetical protein